MVIILFIGLSVSMVIHVYAIMHDMSALC